MKRKDVEPGMLVLLVGVAHLDNVIGEVVAGGIDSYLLVKVGNVTFSVLPSEMEPATVIDRLASIRPE